MYCITMIVHRKLFCYHNDYIMLPTSSAIYIFMYQKSIMKKELHLCAIKPLNLTCRTIHINNNKRIVLLLSAFFVGVDF